MNSWMGGTDWGSWGGTAQNSGGLLTQNQYGMSMNGSQQGMGSGMHRHQDLELPAQMAAQQGQQGQYGLLGQTPNFAQPAQQTQLPGGDLYNSLRNPDPNQATQVTPEQHAQLLADPAYMNYTPPAQPYKPQLPQQQTGTDENYALREPPQQFPVRPFPNPWGGNRQIPTWEQAIAEDPTIGTSGLYRRSETGNVQGADPYGDEWMRNTQQGIGRGSEAMAELQRQSAARRQGIDWAKMQKYFPDAV